ncbi:MAG: MarR family transcriptional regulator [Candidatus Paceibacterota bacterium]|jgi:DNA-binding MarR family transcriptional regulator
MPEDPDEMIFSFFNIYNIFKKRMRGLPKVNVNVTEIGALHFINRNSQTTMKELSEFLEISPPSTTALIDKMIKAGILERSFNDNDRRNVIISFTVEGTEMFKKAKIEKIKIWKEIFSCLNGKERHDLCSICKKMFHEFNLKDNH